MRKMARIILQWYREKKYIKIAEKFSIEDDLVLFESYMGRQYACSPKALYEEMLNDHTYDDFRFVWFFKDINKFEELPDKERTLVVKYGSETYYEYYAKAKYVITNSNIKNEIHKKDGQVFIQTWHGTPLKRLRCDIKVEHGNATNTLSEIRMKNDIDAVRYDGFISPSAFATEKFISAFNLRMLGKENIIIEEGYPRNDFLYTYTEEDVARIKNKLNIENHNKKILLYAPTFRDNQHDAKKGYTYNLQVDFEALQKELGKTHIILFRPHYFIANSFDFEQYKGFVYDVSKVDDINELYVITDLLITDYSSVFFDFANLHRPMLFFMYDLEEYSEEIRGFYLSLDTLPGEIVTNEKDLIEKIKNTEFIYDQKYEHFNDVYNYLDDGKASQRVLKSIFRL